jgi:hypothetical protein
MAAASLTQALVVEIASVCRRDFQRIRQSVDLK